MSKLSHQKRVDHLLEYAHQKNERKSPEKYLLSKLDEGYGKKGYKLNYFNIELNPGEIGLGQEQKYNFKNRNIKFGNTNKLIKRDVLYAKDKLIKIKTNIKKKENSKESNINLNKTEFNYHYSIHTNINHYFKNCNLLLNQKTSTEMESHLDSLWKKLGVNESYISNFNSLKNKIINSEEKNNLIITEIEYLERFRNILENFSEDIVKRENKLDELKTKLEKMNKDGDTSFDKKLNGELTSIICTYIDISIRIIEYYLLYKEIINKGKAVNKFNEDIIKKNFDITKNDMNYISKMKTDTNFLSNLKFNDFKINKDIFNLIKGDPFLTSFNNTSQLSSEIKEQIKYCQYFLIQETINESIQKAVKEPKTNSARKKSQSHITIDAALIPKKNLNIINNTKKETFEESKNPEENININTNLNKTINDTINTTDNLNISYYSGKISEFIPLYNDYFSKIPSEQKIIFNLNEEPLNYFKHNYYPKIILCKDTITNEIKGMCIYSIIFKEHEKKANQIIIEHISSYNKEEMENILTKIFEFIKSNHILNDISENSNNLFTEMFIDLYYYLQNDKFEINKSIKDFIGKTIKFRWVKLENISKVIRFQKMKYVISNKEQDKNVRDSMISIDNSVKSNFMINDICAFNLIKNIINNEENKPNELLDNNKEKIEINPYNIIYILFLMKNIFNIKTIFEQILEKIKIFCTNNKLSLPDEAFINKENNEINLYTFPLQLKQLCQLFEGNFYNKIEISNNNEILPLFDGCIGTKYNNYFYNRIESKDLKIFKDNNTEQIFYLIKSKHKSSISLLISSNLNENFKTKYLLSNDHISFIFKDIYNNLSEVESEQNENESKYIYIPAFTKDKKIEIINNGRNKEEKDIISDYIEKCNIEFLTEENILKKNCKKNNNFEYDLIDDDIKNNKVYIINDDFMIFVLDFDVIEQIEIMPILSIKLKKENFISDI